MSGVSAVVAGLAVAGLAVDRDIELQFGCIDPCNCDSFVHLRRPCLVKRASSSGNHPGLMKRLARSRYEAAGRRLRSGTIRSPAALARTAIRGRASLSERRKCSWFFYYTVGLSKRMLARRNPTENMRAKRTEPLVFAVAAGHLALRPARCWVSPLAQPNLRDDRIGARHRRKPCGPNLTVFLRATTAADPPSGQRLPRPAAASGAECGRRRRGRCRAGCAGAQNRWRRAG